MFYLLTKNAEIITLSLIGISLVVFFWNILLQIQIRSVKKKSVAFFADSKVANIEELILKQIEDIRTLDKDIQELYNISNQINNLAFRSYHKIGMVRFNPFKDVGGDQSFSLAILNGKNNGITLSSLFTREGAHIYSKSILGGKSEKYPLTDEEKEAIKIAMQVEVKK